MTTKQQLLDQVRQRIIDDQVTPELASVAKTMVFGEGDPDAELFFVGEAPGKNEDIQGRPFVGASGKFLEELLQSIGLHREQVYITSILKYRPPGNRDPFPTEKQSFLPYLRAQLEIIQPKVVATLGRHSTNCFLPDLQISSSHGQPQVLRFRRKDNATGIMAEDLVLVVVPLFHPAAALYNGSLRQTLLEDFAKIPQILASTR